MSSPADQDLGALHASREAELERQQLLQWAQQRTAALAAPAAPTENPTPQMQDPSSPAPQQNDIGPGDVARDVGRGIVAAPREVAGGFFDAIKQAGATVKDLADLLPQLPGVIYEPGKGFRIGSGEEIKNAPGALEKLTDVATPDIPGSGTTTGGIIRGISQFATGMLAGNKVAALQQLGELGTAGRLAAPIAKGALAQFAAFDPDQQRLSNLVQEFPALANPVTEYLAADPADSAAEGRFKQALEGAGLGLAVDALGKGVRALRSVSAAKQAAGVTDEAATAALTQASGQQAELTARIGDPAEPALQVLPKPGRAVEPIAPGDFQRPILNAEGQPVGTINGEAKTLSGRPVLQIRNAGIDVEKELGRGYARQAYEDLAREAIGQGRELVSDSEVTESAARVYDSLKRRGYAVTRDPRAVLTDGAWSIEGKPNAPVFRVTVATDQPGEVFVNWSRINSHDDVKAMVQELADARAGNISEAARGVRSWDTTRAAAGELDAWKVLQDRQAGQPLNAEQTVAVRELWIRSGRKVRELAQSVANNGGELDQLAFRKQLLVHNAIQEQVIPARKETARALNAWAIPAGDTPAFAGQMDQLKALAQSDPADLAQIARGITSLGDAGLLREADAFVESSTLAKSGAALRQAWYGALLSNPKTLVRNLTGNTSNLLLNLPETQVASFISKNFGEGEIPTGEAMQRLFGMVQGYKDAWRVSAKSRQVFDSALTKMAAEGDEAGARALFSEEADQFYSSFAPEAQGGVRPYEVSQGGAFDPEKWGIGRDSIAGRSLAWIETATTAPSRALQRTDEMFKSMAYNSELRTQAYRQATQELERGAIEKAGFSDRLAEILSSPSDAMRLAARSHAEVQTFTNSPKDTPLWGMVKAWHNVPVFGDITMPFARTPYNIATQTMQRTPLSPFMRSWREDILAGGPRGHQAWSRFIVGNTVLLTAADLALNGHLTGQGPSDPAERAAMAREGWKPWSVRVGDTYYDYRAIDPIGPLVGLAANTIDILKAKDFGRADADGRFEQLVVATSMSIAAQVTNQSFMSGAASFFDAIQDPQRYGEKWWQQLATSALIPRGVAALERTTDPTQRVAWDIATSIRAQTPGLSKGLPPARDVWGRPITSGSGFGPWYDLLSPFTASERTPNPVDTELQRLEHWIPTPPRKLSFGGVSVDLATNPKAYSRFVELAGNGTKIDGAGLFDKLSAIIAGKDESSDVYESLTDGPDGSKAMLLDRYVHGYQQAAKVQLLDEFPEVRAELDRRRQEKQEALAPR